MAFHIASNNCRINYVGELFIAIIYTCESCFPDEETKVSRTDNQFFFERSARSAQNHYVIPSDQRA